MTQFDAAYIPVIKGLVARIQALENALGSPGVISAPGSPSGGADPLLTYLTELDETAGLPNSRQLLAGDNVTLDDTVPGALTIHATGGGSPGGGGGADETLTYVTVSDETAGLPNSRRLVAGSNVSFDTSTAGQFEISATGGGGGSVQQTSLVLTHTNLTSMFATPITVVSAPGANKMIMPIMLAISSNLVTAYGQNNAIALYYNGANPAVSFLVTGMTNTTTKRVIISPIVNQVANTSAWANVPLMVSNATSALTGGNAANEVRLELVYTIVDVL